MSYGYGGIFNDVKQVWAGGLTYDKMVERTKTIKPYRGGLSNAYPMGWREYSPRHFRANKDGSFSIYYKNREICVFNHLVHHYFLPCWGSPIFVTSYQP